MMNLMPHHKFHIPNGLAMFAALLLLITSAIGFEANREAFSSGQESTSSVKVETDDNSNIDKTVGHKRHVLNLGSLLFRRG